MSESNYCDAPIAGMDWMIQNLIKIAEVGAEISVTLTTTGGIVTGRIISGKRYIAEVKKAFEGGESDVHEALADWASELSPVFREYDETGPYFIHIINARFMVGGQLTKGGALWRGSLAHVTGITLGALA